MCSGGFIPALGGLFGFVVQLICPERNRKDGSGYLQVCCVRLLAQYPCIRRGGSGRGVSCHQYHKQDEKGDRIDCIDGAATSYHWMRLHHVASCSAASGVSGEEGTAEL
jgi:hypothetical protein